MSGPSDATQSSVVTFSTVFNEVQSAVTNTVEFFAANPSVLCEVLSQAQVRAAANTPRLQAAFFGFAVEAVATEQLMSHPVFSESLTAQMTVVHGESTLRADFCVNGDRTSNIDITTERQAQAHEDRYASFGLSCQCATYSAPENLADLFPSLS